MIFKKVIWAVVGLIMLEFILSANWSKLKKIKWWLRPMRNWIWLHQIQQSFLNSIISYNKAILYCHIFWRNIGGLYIRGFMTKQLKFIFLKRKSPLFRDNFLRFSAPNFIELDSQKCLWLRTRSIWKREILESKSFSVITIGIWYFISELDIKDWMDSYFCVRTKEF